MQYEKLKGVIREHTLNKILRDDTTRITNDPTRQRIYYFTRKSLFVVERKGVKYWKVFQIHGEMDVPNEKK